ncbi:MbtH family NRPS accessory protein [Alkalicoccobacillus plakortidis]|uniref:MbtH family NRPS accessory protein n=1 Tax=Alkalicoccobacillus plakortidis TaxID=444060 RepID=A0ABT0XN75_9BACI|nr:MbtH family NRPS accessory protein [Alkalicoccobacillus plakortidis]
MNRQTLVLKNEKNEHSLWQAWMQVPAWVAGCF